MLQLRAAAALSAASVGAAAVGAAAAAGLRKDKVLVALARYFVSACSPASVKIAPRSLLI